MKRIRPLSALMAIALIAAACGRTAKVGSTTSTTASSGPAAGDFGDLKAVCRPKPAGVSLSASDTGVTARSIQVSTFSDPGFVGRPGLDQEVFDAASAFTRWCNDHGGINGRTIDLKLRDAKFSEFQQRVIEACDQGDFMMVGGGAVLDDTGQSDRLACGLPQMPAFLITGAAEDSDLTVQALPNPSNEQAVGPFRWLGERYPDSTDHVALFTANISTTILQSKKYEEAVKSLGWKIVYSSEYNALGEMTWRPFADAMKAQGVKGIIFVGEPVNLAALMKAFRDVGYTLDWVGQEANMYDPLLLKEGGDAVNGVVSRSLISPFLDATLAKKNPATRQYLEMMAKYQPSGKIAYLGVQGLSAWLLFAVAARDCGANLTRDCVFAKARTYTAWTGGGLHAPQDVKHSRQSQCYTLFGVRNGAFVVEPVHPNTAGIYNCDPKNVVALHGDYGHGAKCPNPAYATDPKPSNCANKP